MLKHWKSSMMFAGCIFATVPMCAQQVEVPLNNTAQAGDPAKKAFDAQHLKDRPYTGLLPKPQFPSTERVQRAFTVAYVYDYAYSEYTPSVDLPVVAKSLVKRDTPENAAIAFFSAQRSGDWDAFLQCWAPEDRKRIEARITNKELDKAKIVAKWKEFYTNRKVLLFDRIETTDYIILDVKIPGPRTSELPAVFKSIEGQWMATNELGTTSNQMLSEFKPGLAGIVRRNQPIDIGRLAGGQKQDITAQREFLEQHTRRSEVIQAAQ